MINSLKKKTSQLPLATSLDLDSRILIIKDGKSAMITASSVITGISAISSDHMSNLSNPHQVTKAQVSLGNVDNTSDVNKPISALTQVALNAKQATVSLTTTGSSGASTFVSNVLNIPNYTLAGLGYVTPTLAVVTTAGNSTTNSIVIGGLTVATSLIYTDTVNGRVGINTLGPTKTFEVNGTVRVGGEFSITDGGANPRYIQVRRATGWLSFGNSQGAESIAMNGSTLLIGAEPDSQGTARVLIKGAGSTVGTTAFLTQNSAGTTTFSILDSGSVGINTITPARALEVFKGGLVDGNVEGIRITVGHASQNAQAAIEFNHTYGVISKIATDIGSGGNSPSMYFFHTGANRMIIANSGNVLINANTDTGYKLYVNGSIWGNTFVGSGFQMYGGGQIFSGNYLQLFNSANTSKSSITYSNTSGLSISNNSENLAGVLKLATIEGNSVAGANGNVLIGLDINPTYTTGIYTGVTSYGLLVRSGRVSNTLDTAPTGFQTHSVGNNSLYWKITQGDRYVAVFENANSYGDGVLIKTTTSHSSLLVLDSGNTLLDVSADQGGIYSIKVTSGSRIAWYAGYLEHAPGVGTNIYGNYATPYITLREYTGNVLIGTTTDSGYRLDVNGTAQIASSSGNYKLVVKTTGVANGAGLLVDQLGYTMLDVNVSDVYMRPYPSPTSKIDFYNWSTVGGTYNTFLLKNSEFTSQGGSYAIPLVRFPDNVIPVVMGNTLSANLRSYFTVGGTFTAKSNLGSGQSITTSVIASANNDVLIGLDVNPTFTLGSFTGLSTLAARFTGNVLMGQVPSSLIAYSYVPLTLSNNAIGALRTQLSLVNGGGSANAGSAIDFFTYTDAGNGNPGLRIAGIDDGNFSGNFQIITKGQGAAGSGALTAKFQVYGGTGNVIIQNGGTFTDAGYRLDVNGTTISRGNLTVGNAGSGVRYDLTFNTSWPGGGTRGGIVWSSGASIVNVRKFGGGNDNTISFLVANNTLELLTIQEHNGTLNTNNVGINNASPHVSAVLDVASTTKGFIKPRMTTTHKNAIGSPVAGLEVFDTDLARPCFYNGTVWITM
jgi:hypothetical protein